MTAPGPLGARVGRRRVSAVEPHKCGDDADKNDPPGANKPECSSVLSSARRIEGSLIPLREGIGRPSCNVLEQANHCNRVEEHVQPEQYECAETDEDRDRVGVHGGAQRTRRSPAQPATRRSIAPRSSNAAGGVGCNR